MEHVRSLRVFVRFIGGTRCTHVDADAAARSLALNVDFHHHELPLLVHRMGSYSDYLCDHSGMQSFLLETNTSFTPAHQLTPLTGTVA